MTVIRWQGRQQDSSLEHLHLQAGMAGAIFEALVLSHRDSGQGTALRYRLHADPSWRTRRVMVQALGQAYSLQLHADGQGNWSTPDGRALPQLAGALDLDLSFTPATNMLPIRRLDLAIGAQATIQAVYVDWPSLEPALAPQRYTRLSAERYLFESLDHDFQREIVVDEAGLVLDYPDLFVRA